MSSALCLAAADVRDLVEQAARRSRELKRAIIVSHVVPLEGLAPLAAFASLGGSFSRRWYWSTPGGAVELAGLGEARAIVAGGLSRFDDVRREWERLAADAVSGAAGGLALDEAAAGPHIFGGFAFRPGRGEREDGTWSGFPDACFILPELMVGRIHGRGWLTVNHSVEPDSTVEHVSRRLCALVETASQVPAGRDVLTACGPARLSIADSDPERWKESVLAVVESIKAGELEKAVLARSLRVEAGAPLDPAEVVRFFEEAYPMCYAFAFQLGERCFIGSTPELLAEKRGPKVQSMALAGSAPRGGTPAEDDRIGRALLVDPKNRGEHAVVAEAVRTALESICDEFFMPDEPELFKLPNVQHLCTPASGTLRSPFNIIEIARRLHPTPAVGGRPLARALQCIAEHEAIDRGWYAGPIGVVDKRGDGTFAVAIRSAVLSGGRADLFAGCGIVEGSDPDVELHESRLKLMPVLAGLERSVAW